MLYTICFATDSPATGSTAISASTSGTTKTWPKFLTTRRLPSTTTSQRWSTTRLLPPTSNQRPSTPVAYFSTTIGRTTSSG